MPKTYTKTDKARMIEMYRAGKTQAEIAVEYGITQTTVGANLRRWKVPTRRVGAKRRHAVNEQYFAEINTEDRAYWLGFLMADGCVQKTSAGNWICRLELAHKDSEHVQNFVKAVDGEQSVKFSACNISNYVDISSIEFCRHLVKLGCVRNKTKDGITFPKLPERLLRHFIRGFFDGDGWFSGLDTNATFGIVSADKEFLLRIQDWLVCKLGLERTKLIEKETTWSLQYCGNTQVPRIAELLYKDCTVALDRKKRIAVSLFSETL